MILKSLSFNARLTRNKRESEASTTAKQTSMSVLLILGRKCMLAALRAARSKSRRVYAARPIKVRKRLDRPTDRRTDARQMHDAACVIIFINVLTSKALSCIHTSDGVVRHVSSLCRNMPHN